MVDFLAHGGIFCATYRLNKCSDRSMKVIPPALIGNYDRQTNRLTDPPTHRRQTYRQTSNSVDSVVRRLKFILPYSKFHTPNSLVIHFSDQLCGKLNK